MLLRIYYAHIPTSRLHTYISKLLLFVHIPWLYIFKNYMCYKRVHIVSGHMALYYIILYIYMYSRARAVVNRFAMPGTTAYECPEIRLLRWTPEAGDKGVSPFTPATETFLFSYLRSGWNRASSVTRKVLSGELKIDILIHFTAHTWPCGSI